MNPCFLIFGFGYTASYLTSNLIAQGFKVVGTKRDDPREKFGSDLPLKLIDFDSSTNIKAYLERCTHILISIPPINGIGDLVLAKYSKLIKEQAKQLQWIGYLSSTGVYGDHQGRWVNERTLCHPQTPTGIARLEAEKSWDFYAEKNQLPLHIFRLSGIYGPGRNALERLKKGKKYSLFKENQVFCRVHVEDIISALQASILFPKPFSIYNVSDDEPAASHLVDNYAAALLQQKALPLVPVSQALLSPFEQEFYSNNRRVSNAKIKKELNIKLKYPSFREGLSQIWKTDFIDK